MGTNIALVNKASNLVYIVKAYYNGVLLGIINAEEDVTITLEDLTTYSKASQTGDSDFKAHNIGQNVTVELNLLTYNKSVFNTVRPNMQDITLGQATNIASPFAGQVESITNPRELTESPLVLYPIFTAGTNLTGLVPGTTYIDDTNNPMAMVFPLAVCVDTVELKLNSTKALNYSLTFRALPDPQNNFRPYVQGNGIQSDGVIIL